MRKTLKDAGDKVKEDQKKEIQEKIDSLKKVKDLDNAEEIKSKTQDLSQAIQKIGAELYKQQPQEKKQGPEGAEEGEYKEKK